MKPDEPLAVIVGAYGWTLYFKARDNVTSHIAGYSFENDDYPQQAMANGVPVIDLRTIADRSDLVAFAVRGPMLDQGREPSSIADAVFGAPEEGKGLNGCGYGPMNYAPLEVYAKLAQDFGATVHNYTIPA